MNGASFEEQLNEHGSFVYTNRGSSMRPLIRQKRDVIVIEKKNGRLKKYDVAFFKRESGAYVLHRVMKVYENDYMIVGDNCTEKERVKEEQVLGVMTELRRGEKIITPENKKYKAYITLWCAPLNFRIAMLKTKSAAVSVLRKLGFRRKRKDID